MPAPADAVGFEGLVAPVRHQATDGGRSLGSWAAGADFKCGVDDGAFTLVPYLGRSAPTNAPWRWRTVAASLGGVDLLGAAPARPDHGPLRLQHRRGLVAERWDVRADAVEQSFVIDAAPVRGDLVIRGAIDGALRAEPRAAAVVPLTFRDADGRVELVYGTALAIDADGDTWPVAVACDGEHVELRLDAAAVAAADFPLLVDPLLTVYVIDSGTLPTGSGIVDSAIDHVAASDRMTLVRAEVRWASAFDGDLFVWKCRDDFAVSQLLYSDVATQIAAYDVSVAAADQNASYVVAWSRGAVGGPTAISWFVQGADDMALPVVRTAIHPSSTYERSPRVAGRRGAVGPVSRALLVRVRDGQNSSTDITQLWGSLIDCATGNEGTPFLISGTGAALGYDHEEPWVTRDIVGTSASWLVANQIWRPADDRWSVQVRRVTFDGVVANGVYVPDMPPGGPFHAMQPRVEGSNNRYLIAFATAAIGYDPGKLTSFGGRNVYVQRFSWSGFVPSDDHPVNNVAGSFARDLHLGGLAHDSETQSHWVLTHGFLQGAHTVQRLGYRGRLLDSTALPGPVGGQTTFRPASVAYDRQLDRFPLHYGVRNTLNGVASFRSYGGRHDHPALATPSGYGSSCGGAGNIGSTGRFLVGNELAGVAYHGASPGVLLACVLSLGQGTTPLSAFGVGGGCSVFVDLAPASYLGAVFLVADGSGDARLYLPLPEDFSALDLDAQWLVLQANGSVRSTYGLHVEIR